MQHPSIRFRHSLSLAAAVAALATGRGADAQAGAPCASAAPSREALRGAPSARDVERAMVELHAARPSDRMVRLRTRQGYLGVSTLEVSDVRVTPSGRFVCYGSYPVVVRVDPGSPADRAGLERGDTLIAYNERDLVRSGEIALDSLLVPGHTLRVSLRREGRGLTRPVVVGERPVRVTTLMRTWTTPHGSGTEIVRPGGPADVMVSGDPRPPRYVVGTAPRAPRPPRVPQAAGGVTPPEAPLPPGFPEPSVTLMPSMPPGFVFSFNAGGPAVIAGAQLVPMDDELREALGVRPGAGVLVVRVPEGSPAADAGLRSGDVIRAANGRAVASVGALQRTLLVAQEQGMAAHAAAGDDARAVRLEIVRKGKARTVTLRW